MPGSYDGTRVMPVAESLRHKGIPYAYLPDRRLERLGEFSVVVLPEAKRGVLTAACRVVGTPPVATSD